MKSYCDAFISGIPAASAALAQNHADTAVHLAVSVLVCLLNVRVWLCLL